MRFVARFLCCATIDFNSILKYFPRGYDNKFYIKIFGYLSNYWSVKKSRGLFLFKRNEMKNCKGTLTPKMSFAAIFSWCAMVVLMSPVKCIFPTLLVCLLWLVALFQQGSHHLTPLFVLCLFLTGIRWNASFSTGFCFSIHCPVSKPAGSKCRWFLLQLRLALLSFQVCYNWWQQCLIALCCLDETSKFSHSPHGKVC